MIYIMDRALICCKLHYTLMCLYYFDSLLWPLGLHDIDARRRWTSALLLSLLLSFMNRIYYAQWHSDWWRYYYSWWWHCLHKFNAEWREPIISSSVPHLSLQPDMNTYTHIEGTASSSPPMIWTRRDWLLPAITAQGRGIYKSTISI